MNEVYGFAAVIVSIFASQLVSTRRLDRLGESIDRMGREVGERIDRLHTDLTLIHQEFVRHDARLSALEGKAS
jgi:hypothetical protein